MDDSMEEIRSVLNGSEWSDEEPMAPEDLHKEEMLKNFPLVLNPYEDAKFLMGLDTFKIDEKEDFKRIVHAHLLSDGSKSLVGGWDINLLKAAVKESFNFDDVKRVDEFVKAHFNFLNFDKFIRAAKDIAEVKDDFVLPFLDSSSREIYQDAIDSVKNKEGKARRHDEAVAKRIENVENIEGFYRGVNRLLQAVEAAQVTHCTNDNAFADVAMNDGTTNTVVGINYNHVMTEYEKLFGKKLDQAECKVICGRSTLNKALIADGTLCFKENFCMQQHNTEKAKGMFIAARPGFKEFTDDEIKAAIEECRKSNAEKQTTTRKYWNRDREKWDASRQTQNDERPRVAREEPSTARVSPTPAPPTAAPRQTVEAAYSREEIMGVRQDSPPMQQHGSGGEAQAMVAARRKEEEMDSEEEEDDDNVNYSDEDSDQGGAPKIAKMKAKPTVSAPAPVETVDSGDEVENGESPTPPHIVRSSSLFVPIPHYDGLEYESLPPPTHVVTRSNSRETSKEDFFKMQLAQCESRLPSSSNQTQNEKKQTGVGLGRINDWEEEEEDSTSFVQPQYGQQQQEQTGPTVHPSRIGTGIFDPHPVQDEAYDMPSPMQQQQQGQQMQQQQRDFIPPQQMLQQHPAASAPSSAFQKYPPEEQHMQHTQQQPYDQQRGVGPHAQQSMSYAGHPQEGATPSQSGYYMGQQPQQQQQMQQPPQSQQQYGGAPPMGQPQAPPPLHPQQGGQEYPPNQQYYPGQQGPSPPPPPPQSTPNCGQGPMQPQGYQQGPPTAGYGVNGHPYQQQGPVPPPQSPSPPHVVHVNVHVPHPPPQQQQVPYGAPPQQGYPSQTPPPGGYPAAPPNHSQYQPPPPPPQSAFAPPQGYSQNSHYQQPQSGGFGAPQPQCHNYHQGGPPPDPNYSQPYQQNRDPHYRTPHPPPQQQYTQQAPYRDQPPAPANYRNDGYGRDPQRQETKEEARIRLLGELEALEDGDEQSVRREKKEYGREDYGKQRSPPPVLFGAPLGEGNRRMDDGRSARNERREASPSRQFGAPIRKPVPERRNEGRGGGRDDMEYPEARSDYSPSTSQRREENGGFGMQSGWGERERVPSEPRSAFAVGRVTKEEEARLFGRGNGNEGGVRFQQEERRQRRGEEERGRGGNGGHNNNNSGTNGNSFAVKMQLDTPHKRVKFQIVELLKWRRDLNLSRPQNEYQLLEAEKLFSLLQIATGEEMDIYWVTEKMEKDLYWFIEQMEVRENLLVRYSGQAWNAAANKFIEVMYVTDPDYVPPPHLRLRRVRNVDG